MPPFERVSGNIRSELGFRSPSSISSLERNGAVFRSQCKDCSLSILLYLCSVSPLWVLLNAGSFGISGPRTHPLAVGFCLTSVVSEVQAL